MAQSPVCCCEFWGSSSVAVAALVAAPAEEVTAAAVLAAAPAVGVGHPAAGNRISVLLYNYFRAKRLQNNQVVRQNHTIFCVFHRFVTIFSNRKVTKRQFCCMINKNIKVLRYSV